MFSAEQSREKATYGGGVFHFLLPEGANLPEADFDRNDYRTALARLQLPGRLVDFLTQAFENERIRRCGLRGSLIRIEATTNIPGSIATALEAMRIQLMWQAFMDFYGQTDENDPRFWRYLPRTRHERGDGRDLGEAGFYMARYMDNICGMSGS